MADNTQTTVISVQIDETAKAKLVKGLADVQATIRKVAAESVKMGESAQITASRIAGLTKEEKALKASISAIESGIDKQADSFRNAESAVKSYEASLSSVKQSGADLSGDVAGSFGGLRGAVGALGGGAASPALDILEGFADIGEFAPKLKVQLEGVGAVLASGGTIASTFAGQAGTAVAGFTGISVGLGTVLAVAAPVAIAIAGVALAFKNFQDQSTKQAEQLNAIIDARRQVGQDIAGGLTTEQAQEQITALQRQKEAEQELLTAQQNAYDAAIQQLGLLGGLAQQIAPQEQALADQIQASKNAIAGYDASIAALSSQLDSGEIAANDTAVAEQELATVREQESQRAIQEAEQSAQRVAQLNQQINDLNANRAIQESNAAASSKQERKFAQEDEKAETAAHWANLADIAKQGQSRVASIQAEIAKIPAALSADLADIQNKGNAKLKDTQDEYFKGQIEATKDFAKSQKRIATETAKTAKRLADDIADNLADAARANDVVAFLKIQRDGQKDLTRNAQDASASERQRTEDFIAAQEKERESFRAKQADILNGIAEERARVLQSYQERRSALEAQIQQERANTQAAIANANARYQTSEAQEAQAAARDAQRRALRQSQEDAAFQRSISAIQSRINSENSLYGVISAGIARVAAQANSLASAKASSKASSSSSGGKYKSPYEKGSFANNKSFGAGGTTINVASMNVGDIATASQVTNALRAFATQSGQATMNGINGAQK